MPKDIRPYIDSSVWLGWKNREIVNGVDRFSVFQSIWEAAQRGEFKLFISAMTFAEVYKLRHESFTQPVQTVAQLLADFEESFIEVVETDRDIGIQANVMCRQFAAYKLYPNDSIHLASALRVPCDYLLCYDRPLSSVTMPDIIIAEPEKVLAPAIQNRLEGL